MVIILLGTAWHYLYAWSCGNRWLGAIVPVNESVWEHLKMGYWSLVAFSAVEYVYIRHKVHNYFLAKLTGVLSLIDCILIIHYTTVALTGRVVLWADILSYIIGAVVCQYVAYHFYLLPQERKRSEALSLLAFVALGAVLIITTYYPPHYQIFRDKNTNTIGIDQAPY